MSWCGPDQTNPKTKTYTDTISIKDIIDVLTNLNNRLNMVEQALYGTPSYTSNECGPFQNPSHPQDLEYRYQGILTFTNGLLSKK